MRFVEPCVGNNGITRRFILDNRTETFDAFWAHYLNEHSNPLNRALHVVGTTMALAFLVFIIVVKMPLLLLLVPVIGYGPAWVGHFFIEHNRPTAMKRPLWSFRADLKMTWLVLSGQLKSELRRVQHIAILAGSVIVPLTDIC